MNGRNLLLVVGSMVAVGLLLVGFATTQPAEPTPMPTHAAYAVGYQIPTPTPTIPSVVGQPASWFWYQLPADVQKAILNQMNRVPPPAPSDLIDFEVGPKGCRWTIEGNATEQGSDSLAGDCGELLRILNPVPPAPIVTPSPTPTPVATEFIGAMYDPRPDGAGVIIEVHGKYGEWYATASRELEAGSGIFHIQALPSNDIIVSGAVVYMTTDANGQPAVELDYWNGSAVRSELFVLDDWFPIKHLESEPTATPTPKPITVQYDVQKVAIGFPLWIRFVPGQHVLAFYRGNMRGYDTLLDREWFVDPIGEIIYARLRENAIEYTYKVAYIDDPKGFIFVRGQYQLPADWDK